MLPLSGPAQQRRLVRPRKWVLYWLLRLVDFRKRGCYWFEYLADWMRSACATFSIGVEFWTIFSTVKGDLICHGSTFAMQLSWHACTCPLVWWPASPYFFHTKGNFTISSPGFRSRRLLQAWKPSWRQQAKLHSKAKPPLVWSFM